MTKSRSTKGWVATPPFQSHLGIETVEAVDGRSLLRYVHRGEFGNRKGDVHGGVLATIADLATSQAVRSTRSDIAGMSTISLTINYLEPAAGDLVARGKAVKVGGTIGVGEATCEMADGTVVMQATGIFRMIRHKP